MNFSTATRAVATVTIRAGIGLLVTCAAFGTASGDAPGRAPDRTGVPGTRAFAPEAVGRLIADTTSPDRFAADLDQAFHRFHNSALAGDAGFEPLDVNLVFHVLSGPSSEGDLSESRLVAQVGTVNDAYAAAGLRFRIAQVRRYRDSPYFAGGCYPTTEQGLRMKAELAVDPRRFVNVYLCEMLRPYIVGSATLPNEFPENDARHGVVVDYGTITGGDAPFEPGHTLVHELGHYFGLFHTFQGGCQEPGDGVADTPAEAEPAYGCQVGRDSCPQAGSDPVDNFMDYSDDACTSRFTPLQKARMRAAIATFRPSLAGPFSIGPGMTGNWYDPAQNGHGIQLEILPNGVATAVWFTFDDAGNPAWISGAGTIAGNRVAMDAGRVLRGRFPPHFDPNTVERRAWGTLTFEFADCTHGEVRWASTDTAFTPAGRMVLARLTSVDGLACP